MVKEQRVLINPQTLRGSELNMLHEVLYESLNTGQWFTEFYFQMGLCMYNSDNHLTVFVILFVFGRNTAIVRHCK